MISEMAAPPTTGQQTVSRWLPAVVVVLLAIGIASIYEHSRSRTEVRVISPAYRDIELTVSAVGTVVPTNDFPARATFSGLVDGIFVHLGQHVRPGQLLFTISTHSPASTTPRSPSMTPRWPRTTWNTTVRRKIASLFKTTS
jgi:multidrug efflux pump subunit AcrA (membrane-fusion protein)